jgi:curved DNA-binding protein CbpA
MPPCTLQAYRKLALLKHPDKNPDNPRAADEFAVLQKAYELLLDAEARAALDGLLK